MKPALPISLLYKQPFKYLSSRNLMYAVSNQKLMDTEPLSAFLPSTSSVYIGFDPTAQSLHLGNLTGLIALNYFRLAGMSLDSVYLIIVRLQPYNSAGRSNWADRRPKWEDD